MAASGDAPCLACLQPGIAAVRGCSMSVQSSCNHHLLPVGLLRLALLLTTSLCQSAVAWQEAQGRHVDFGDDFHRRRHPLLRCVVPAAEAQGLKVGELPLELYMELPVEHWTWRQSAYASKEACTQNGRKSACQAAAHDYATRCI